MKENEYDVVIVGAGPAGLTAGIYCGRANMRTLIIEKFASGGQIALTDIVENYPGFEDGINGYELTQKMEKQAKKFGVEFYNDEVIEIKKIAEKVFIIKTNSSEFKAKSILISTGTRPNKLGLPDEDKFIGNGISFCATCDGAFYKNKTVAVVGGGDSAIDEAIFLTKFANKVYIIHRRDSLRANKNSQMKAFNNPKIEFIWNSVVAEYIGDKKIEKLTIKNVKTGEFKNIDVDGVFLYVGIIPNTEFVKNLLNIDDRGFIITDNTLSTSVKGIFAAGDCRNNLLKQVSTAVGEGALAATMIEKYIES